MPQRKDKKEKLNPCGVDESESSSVDVCQFKFGYRSPGVRQCDKICRDSKECCLIQNEVMDDWCVKTKKCHKKCDKKCEKKDWRKEKCDKKCDDSDHHDKKHDKCDKKHDKDHSDSESSDSESHDRKWDKCHKKKDHDKKDHDKKHKRCPKFPCSAFDPPAKPPCNEFNPVGPCVPNPADIPQLPPSYDEMVQQLMDLREKAKANGIPYRLKVAGTSVCGRPLYYVILGCGKRSFMGWGSLHGNEGVGTGAWMMILDYLTNDGDCQHFVAKRTTLIIIPMWNPDGHEMNIRFGAPLPGFPDGQDMNRDWWAFGDPRLKTPESTNYIYPESRDWYAVYDCQKPDYILDIHQYGGVTRFPGTNDFVNFQIGTAQDVEQTPEQILLSAKMGQVSLTKVESLGRCIKAARFVLSSPVATASRSALRRMMSDGQFNFDYGVKGHTPKGGIFYEIPRVFPEFNEVIWRLAFKTTLALIISIATDEVLEIDPAGFINLPAPIRLPCETENGDPDQAQAQLDADADRF